MDLSNMLSFKNVDKMIHNYELNSAGPPQLTPDWIKVRNEPVGAKGNLKRLGGSEIATLIGDNPYKKLDQFLLEKSGIGDYKFDGNISCWFGLLIEEIGTQVFNHIQGTTVRCKNISIVDSVIRGLMYSPDGMAAMPVDKSGRIIVLKPGEKLDTAEVSHYIPVLIEIKSPYSRIPVAGQVPKQYVAQVQTGMMCINFVKGSVFIDNHIRVCGRGDMDCTRDYNKLLFRDRSSPESPPKFFGYIKFVNIEYLTRGEGTCVDRDLGGLTNYNTFTTVMCEIVKYIHRTDGEYIMYSDVFERADECLAKLDAELAENAVVDLSLTEQVPKFYYMCWKMYDTNQVVVQKDAEKLKVIKTMIDAYLNGDLIDASAWGFPKPNTSELVTEVI